MQKIKDLLVEFGEDQNYFNFEIDYDRFVILKMKNLNPEARSTPTTRETRGTRVLIEEQ